MAEYASNGKGNLGVTLGAIGTGLGALSSAAAYNLIRLEALLWDLDIADPDIEKMILRNAGCRNVRVRV